MKLEQEAKQWMKERYMSDITATEYQRKAAETAIFPKEKALEYLTLGLTGEAGEIANKIKKVVRDTKQPYERTSFGGYLGFVKGKKVEYKDAVIGEIGDVLWYCAMLATEVDANLGKIMEDNLEKLADRKARNRLQGDGDNR